MKGSSENDPKKPAAKVTPPDARPPQDLVSQGDDQETVERIQRQAELDSRNAAKQNKVAKILDQSYYITEWTHPCLFFEGRQSSVTEFYPAIKVAIDKFYNAGEHEKRLTDFKREVLKKEGIKYAFLTPEKNLADIEADLED